MVGVRDGSNVRDDNEELPAISALVWPTATGEAAA
jgi:hypothetical protein